MAQSHNLDFIQLKKVYLLLDAIHYFENASPYLTITVRRCFTDNYIEFDVLNNLNMCHIFCNLTNKMQI